MSKEMIDAITDGDNLSAASFTKGTPSTLDSYPAIGTTSSITCCGIPTLAKASITCSTE